MANGQITTFVLESLVGHLEKFYSPAFYPRSTVGLLVAGSCSFFPFLASACPVGRDAAVRLHFPASPATAPPPSTPSAFPPTPLGREEVARWLMSLGSNVPLCNMKP